jgi:hypothetical protein
MLKLNRLTNLQLYLSVGVPSFVAVASITVNVILCRTLRTVSSSLKAVADWMRLADTRMAQTDARVTKLERWTQGNLV